MVTSKLQFHFVKELRVEGSLWVILKLLKMRLELLQSSDWYIFHLAAFNRQ
jgi:hypothetical protein